MNNFAKVKHIGSYDKVEYYSVCLDEDDDTSLFELFIQKHSVENKDKLLHIINWIKEIGEVYGALDYLFRNEAETSDTSALPPAGIEREPTYIELNNYDEEVNTANNLRLYCFRANESVVFLYNGDIKTERTAQECDNVRPHFKLANTITAVIESKFGDGITWNGDFTDIEIEEDFELNW